MITNQRIIVQKTILILDDEESIRKSFSAFLEDEGYIVFQAASTEEALEVLKNNEIHRAIVDIRLPDKDGNVFMIEAKKINPEIKFIISTGSSDYILPETVKKLGVSSEHIFIKPVGDLKILKDALLKT